MIRIHASWFEVVFCSVEQKQFCSKSGQISNVIKNNTPRQHFTPSNQAGQPEKIWFWA
jgi:hypothetical protein